MEAGSVGKQPPPPWSTLFSSNTPHAAVVVI
jgi:hypothetical protein